MFVSHLYFCVFNFLAHLKKMNYLLSRFVNKALCVFCTFSPQNEELMRISSLPQLCPCDRELFHFMIASLILWGAGVLLRKCLPVLYLWVFSLLSLKTVSEFWLWRWGFSIWSWCLCRWKIKISVHSSTCRCTVCPAAFVEEAVCSPVCILPYLSNLSGCSCVGSSLGPLFYPTDVHVCLCTSAVLLLLLWLSSIA